MAIAALTSTTLSAAIDRTQTRFQVASTSGINGLGSLTSPQSLIVVGGEAMLVLNVPISGYVEVTRGASTRARSHASGTTVWIGAKTQFDASRFGEDGLIGLTGEPTAAGLPYYRLPLGNKVMDPNTGFEYRLCDYQAVFAVGDWVIIDASGLASALGTGSKGRVGIITEVTVSDTWGWVGVAGSFTATRSSSSVTTGCVLKAGTAAADISTSTGGNVIFNATYTAVSGNASGTAYIDNPWCYGLTTDIVP
jgi:hypothetical protein